MWITSPTEELGQAAEGQSGSHSVSVTRCQKKRGKKSAVFKAKWQVAPYMKSFRAKHCAVMPDASGFLSVLADE